MKKYSSQSIVIDGISYRIPKYLRDATNEEITRVITGWHRDSIKESLANERALNPCIDEKRKT